MSAGVRASQIPAKMTTNVSVDGGCIADDVQDTGVRGTKQLVSRAVLDTMDQGFRREERRFDDLIVMGHNTNIYRNIDRRRPRAADAYGDSINRPVTANRRFQFYDDDSEEEDEELLEDQSSWRRGYGDDRYRRSYYHGYNYKGGGDFKLKVKIPNFYGNLTAEEFLDWLSEVDWIFEYMEIPEKCRVRLVVCKLKGEASAWWENLQYRRDIEGRHSMHTWFYMKQLLKQEFLPLDYERILFQQHKRSCQGQRPVREFDGGSSRLRDESLSTPMVEKNKPT